MIEGTLVFGPVLLYLVEIVIVEGMVEMFWVLVVKRTSAAELILFPLSVIGQPLGLVKQFSIALDVSVYPLSFVHATILVIKSAYSMFDAINFIPLVSTTLSVSLPHILSQSIALKRIGSFVVIQIAH